MVFSEEFSIRTKGQTEAIDITSQVHSVLSKCPIKEGFAIVFVPHATAALYLNEHESGLISDVLSFFDIAVPDRPYLHNRIDDNARAHLGSILFKPFLILPITAGKLDLGTWQNIFLLEMDGPRTRRVIVKAIGE